MTTRFNWRELFSLLTLVVVLGYGLVVALFFLAQRSILYLPSRDAPQGPLTPWIVDDQVIGYADPVAEPAVVWLALQGNAGQASQRAYYRKLMRPQDALYVLDYPGYGERTGQPTKASIDGAVAAAAADLRQRYPGRPLGVLGDSFGSGPASQLARSAQPPEHLVLTVPYDELSRALQGLFSFLPWRLILRDNWDNVEALRGYGGTVTIYAAEQDQSIPPRHAQRLADNVPQARLVMLPGGHGQWPESELVRIAPP